jgi:bacterioferritin-associated ferredoxin
MADIQENRKKDVICACSGTTSEQIRGLIDRGVTDLDGISQASGACSGCGACDTDVLQLIADYVSK